MDSDAASSDFESALASLQTSIAALAQLSEKTHNAELEEVIDALNALEFEDRTNDSKLQEKLDEISKALSELYNGRLYSIHAELQASISALEEAANANRNVTLSNGQSLGYIPVEPYKIQDLILKIGALILTLVFGVIAILSFVLNTFRTNIDTRINEDVRLAREALRDSFEQEKEALERSITQLAHSAKDDMETAAKDSTDSFKQLSQEIEEKLEKLNTKDTAFSRIGTADALLQAGWYHYRFYDRRKKYLDDQKEALNEKEKDLIALNALMSLEQAVELTIKGLDYYQNIESEFQKEDFIVYSTCNNAYYCAELARAYSDKNPVLAAKYTEMALHATTSSKQQVDRYRQELHPAWHHLEESRLHAEYHTRSQLLKNSPDYRSNFEQRVKALTLYEHAIVDEEWVEETQQKWAENLRRLTEQGAQE